MKIKLSKYAKMTGVSVRTLWRRINDGTLDVVRSETGRVFIEVNEDVKPYNLNICVYTRVSSSENKDNLERQKERFNQRDLLAANNILKEGRRSSGDITNAETEVTKSMKRLEKHLVII